MLDKERHLRYTLGTRRRLVAEVGGEDELAKFTGDKVALILLHGLKHEDPELTLAAVEEMVDLRNLEAVAEALAKALGYKGASVAKPVGPPQ